MHRMDFLHMCAHTPFFQGILKSHFIILCMCSHIIAESAPVRGLSDSQGWALVQAQAPKAVFLTWFCSYGPHRWEHIHVEEQAQTVQWTISWCHHNAGNTIGHIIGHITGCYHQKHHWMHLCPSGWRQTCLAQTPELDPAYKSSLKLPVSKPHVRCLPHKMMGDRQLVPSYHVKGTEREFSHPVLVCKWCLCLQSL